MTASAISNKPRRTSRSSWAKGLIGFAPSLTRVPRTDLLRSRSCRMIAIAYSSHRRPLIRIGDGARYENEAQEKTPPRSAGFFLSCLTDVLLKHAVVLRLGPAFGHAAGSALVGGGSAGRGRGGRGTGVALGGLD